MNYGNILKSIRTAELLSQEKLAQMLNIKRSTYKEYELQNKIIPIKHLNTFSNIFNVSIDYLLGLTNNKINYKDNHSNINPKETGLRLKEFRKSLNLTQEKLADKLNVARSIIGEYEKGNVLISTHALYTLCKKYDISADYLLGKSNIKKRET